MHPTDSHISWHSTLSPWGYACPSLKGSDLQDQQAIACPINSFAYAHMCIWHFHKHKSLSGDDEAELCTGHEIERDPRRLLCLVSGLQG